MSNDLILALRIKADLKQAREQLAKIEKSVDKFDKTSNDAAQSSKKFGNGLGKTGDGARKAADGIGRASDEARDFKNSANQLQPVLRRMAGLLAAAFSVREVEQASNSMVTIRNRLALVTDSSEELTQAQDAVFKVAQEGRQPLLDTAELYQRIATNADDLELSGSGVVDVVGLINKTLAISNTSGQAASAAIGQLSQSFSSGVLRGEELNSVLEQAPALASAIAAGLGVTTGELRALGQDGQLTARNVVQALQSQGDAIDQQFQKIEVTARQAAQRFGNSITKIVGELDSAAGSSAAFADLLVNISQYLDTGVLTNGLITALSIWSETFATLGSDIATIGLDFDALEFAATETLGFIGKAFINLPSNIKSSFQILVVESLALFDKLVAWATLASDSIKAVFSKNTTVDQAAAQYEKRLQSINAVRLASIETILDENNAIKEGAKIEAERRLKEREALEVAAAERRKEIEALRNKAKGDAFEFGESDAAGKQQESYVRNLEKQAAQLTLTTTELNNYENAQKGLTGTLLERAQAAQTVIAQSQDEQALAKVNVQLLRAQGLAFEATALDFENQYGELIERLQARGDQEGLSLVDQILDLQQLENRLSEAQQIIEQALSNQSQTEATINAQREAGLITESEARRQLVDIYRETTQELEKQKPLLEELAQQPGVVGETATKALAQLQSQSNKLISTVDKFSATVRDSLESGLTDAIVGLAKGTATFEEAIEGLVQTVANAIIQLTAQQFAQSAVTSLVGIGSGVAAFADGGHVRGPGTGTSDSIPARLSNNEFVTRAAVVLQPQALDFLNDFNARGMRAISDWAPARHSTGGLAGYPAPAMPTPTLGIADLPQPAPAMAAQVDNNFQFNLIDDPQRMADVLQTPQGRKSFEVLISSDPAKFRQLLGVKD